MAQRVGPFEEADRYELVELRARGGEGELWRATITVDGQPLAVAVKIIHPVAGQDLGEWAQRWRRQAELLRSLEHPGLVRVREVFEGPTPHDDWMADPNSRALYLVMNWVEGQSLVEWVGQNPTRDPLECTRIASRLAGAIAYLHSGQATGGVPVLHQDIKPANVIVNGADVRLVDFGFARLLSPAAMTLAGTPAYLAPEILAGAGASEASDRFGLGATTYFLFTGEDPNLSDYNRMRSRLEAVAGISDREGFANHVLSMMARDPAARPSQIVDWAQTLAVGAVSQRFTATAVQPAVVVAAAAGAPRRSKRGRILALAVVALLLVGGAAFALTKGGGKKGASAKSSTTVPGSGASTTDSTTSTSTTTTTTLPTEMPDVVGKTLADATEVFNEDGVEITTVDVLDEKNPDGTVLSQDPAAGAPFASSVKLRIARQPVIEFLADDHPVAGDIGTGQGTLSGTPYVHSLLQDTQAANCGGDASNSVSYDLGKHYRRLRGTLGLSDDGSDTAVIKVEIFGDGRLLGGKSYTIKLDQVVNLDIDVTGVLRLKLVNTGLSNTDQDCSLGKLVWGDLEILGAQSDVPSTTTTTF